MRIRGNITIRYPCNGKGTAHNVIHEVVAGSSVPLVFNNQSILPYNQQTCQCECNAPLGDVVVIGEFCEDTLNGNETLCYYSCVDTSSCREVLKSWHAQYVYSSYPNTYTDDIRYMYEDMKLRNVVQDVRGVRAWSS